MLKKQLRGISSLLSSISLIGVCVGMTSTLLSLRATIEGFGTLVTGFIMSAYFIGYLFGSTRAPKDIRRVGYIRLVWRTGCPRRGQRVSSSYLD